MNLTWHPLCWPEWQRPTPPSDRTDWPGRPLPTVATVWPQLRDEINRHDAVTHWVLSSDVPVGKDGRALSTMEYKAVNPGVAFWLKRSGVWICVACDRFARPSANMRAILLILEGRRREERYGTSAMIEASWGSFRAPSLPAPAPVLEWWRILGVDRNSLVEVVEAVYRTLAAKAHPDVKGGDSDRMAELNAAIEAARKEKNHG
jgi:hypothetical protein